MWTLSGFADEISADLSEQLATLQSENMKYLELRAVWGKGVLKLSDEEIGQVKAALKAAGVGVSAIGSPIGKINITDDFTPHLADFKRALWCAQKLEAPYIRLFSFFVPAGEAATYRAEVMRRMQALVEAAAGSGVTLLHENEKNIYGDIPARCLDIVETVASPQLKLVWDPANFVQCGVRPFTEGYEALRPHIAYVHVKDALLDGGKVTHAGQGDGEWPATIAALRDSGFDGFFSMEPHLQEAERFYGFSGPALFRQATQTFKGLLTAAKVDWC